MHLITTEWEKRAAELTQAPSTTEIRCDFKRYEIKYLLNAEQRACVEACMAEHMQSDEWGPSTVRNLYCDTPTSLLARRSAEHPLYKEKLRLRSYHSLDTYDEVFVEIKKKYDGVVYKRRSVMSYERALAFLHHEAEPVNQIERELAYTIARYPDLAPRMYLAYDREAFVGVEDPDFRVTFDRNIRYRTHNLTLAGSTGGTQLVEKDMSLMELKCAGAIPLWMVRVLSAESLRKTSFSKYGLASARLA